MDNFFKAKSVGSTRKKTEPKEFYKALFYYLKEIYPSTKKQDGYTFPAYKIRGDRYYIITKEDIDEYEIPKEVIIGKFIFHGKTLYAVSAENLDPIIQEYEQKNEMILW